MITARRPDRARGGRSRTVQRGPAAVASSFNPLTALTWYAAYWAGDPAWTPPADGAAVTSWRDGSGNSRTATQATGANQPLFRSSVPELGGRPAVDFDGTNDILEQVTGISIAQPFSVVSVLTFDSGIASGVDLFFGTHSGNAFRGVGLNGGNWHLNSGTSDTDSSAPPSEGVGFLVRALGNGASSTFAANNVAMPAIDSTGTASINQIVMGGGRNATGPAYANYASCKIAFLAVVAGNVTSDPGWASFLNWVEEHYSIPLA